ncbi:MAG TPA: 2-phospho-L-lactate guanylyltransferase [Mycobacteriales bacterium]|nr:2-phospho-L-lactate guanylyltransferase [Mycobacteriales bacterium]
MREDVPTMRWTAVIPVKRLAAAKTRLQVAGMDAADRRALALALAVDTVGAVCGCAAVRRVMVVTDDVEAAMTLEPLGVTVVGDEPDAGLNPALAHGATQAARLAPGDGVAVLSADLPALRAAELAGALRVASAHPRAFLPDAAGTGTTLLTARPGVPLDPRYGPDSRAAHRDSGAVELPGRWPSLRRDVDTPGDLAEAARLGLGSATRGLVRR